MPLATVQGQRDTCFYDGACGFCRRSVRILRALDWGRRLQFEDLTRQTDPDLVRAIALGMPLRTPAGQLLVGFPAVRRALRRTPLGLLPALVLYVPGLSWVGEWVYAVIARNRSRDTCALPTRNLPIENPPGPAHTNPS